MPKGSYRQRPAAVPWAGVLQDQGSGETTHQIRALLIVRRSLIKKLTVPNATILHAGLQPITLLFEQVLTSGLVSAAAAPDQARRSMPEKLWRNVRPVRRVLRVATPKPVRGVVHV